MTVRKQGARRATARPRRTVAVRLAAAVDLRDLLAGTAGGLPTMPSIDPARLAALDMPSEPPEGARSLFRMRRRQAAEPVAEPQGYDPLDCYRTF